MQLLQDTFIIEQLQVINEGKSDGPMRIRGVFGRCNEKNNNGRIYPTAVLESQLEKVKPLILERRLCGELDHPQNDTVKLSNASHLVTKLEMKGDDLIGEAEILKTPAGLTAKALIEGGVKIGISSRGMGTLSEDHNGDKIVNEDFRLVTFDLVADPSTRGAFPGLSESTESKFVRESQSKLTKESNFVTMLNSKLRTAYDPWIEEAKTRKKLTRKQRKNMDVEPDGGDGDIDAMDLTRLRAGHDKFEEAMELVRADGHWYMIAEAILETFDADMRKDSETGPIKRVDTGIRRLLRRTAVSPSVLLGKSASTDKAVEKLKAKKIKIKSAKAAKAAAKKGGRRYSDNTEQIAAGTSYKQIGKFLMEATATATEPGGFTQDSQESDEAAERRASSRERRDDRRKASRDAKKTSATTGDTPRPGFIRTKLNRAAERNQKASDAIGDERAKAKGERERLKQATTTARTAGQEKSRTDFEAGEQARTGNMGMRGEIRHSLGRIKQKLTPGGSQPGKKWDFSSRGRSVQQMDADAAKKASGGKSGGGDNNPPKEPVKVTTIPPRPVPHLPKDDDPKPNTPKPNTPEPNTPKPNTPEPNTPETPKPNKPKPETPKPNTPKPETPDPHRFDGWRSRFRMGNKHKGGAHVVKMGTKLNPMPPGGENPRQIAPAKAKTPLQIDPAKAKTPLQIAPAKDKPERFDPIARAQSNINQRRKDAVALRGKRDAIAKARTPRERVQTRNSAKVSRDTRKNNRKANWISPTAGRVGGQSSDLKRDLAHTQYAQIGSVLAEAFGLLERKTFKSMGPAELHTDMQNFEREQAQLPAHKKLNNRNEDPTARKERLRRARVAQAQSGTEL